MVTIKKIIEAFSKMFKQKSISEDIISSPPLQEIIPYLKPYSLHQSDEFGVNRYLKELGTPMTSEEYKEIFNEKINKNNFIENKENFEVLTHIFEERGAGFVEIIQ